MCAAKKHESVIDARVRIVAAFLEPPLRFARLAGLPLDELQELVAQGYFRELSRRGMSWSAMAKRMDKSRSTVAGLARRTAEADSPLVTSDRFSIQRRIVRKLANGKLQRTEALLASLSEFRAKDVREALGVLTAEGLVKESDDQVQISTALLDVMGPGFDERLASLRHVLSVMSQTVFHRFFSDGGAEHAFARVLTFSSRQDAGVKLSLKAYDALETAVVKEDAAASKVEHAGETSVIVVCSEKPEAREWGTAD